MRAVKRYLSFYMEHMLLEEAVILPAAQRVLDEQDWAEPDAAFATNCDPLTGKYPRDATNTLHGFRQLAPEERHQRRIR